MTDKKPAAKAKAEPVFKAPTLTSAAQRRAEDLAERVDVWSLANRLIREAGEWDSEPEPFDVLVLAKFLIGTDSD